jgi:hypothetical protein
MDRLRTGANRLALASPSGAVAGVGAWLSRAAAAAGTPLMHSMSWRILRTALGGESVAPSRTSTSITRCAAAEELLARHAAACAP